MAETLNQELDAFWQKGSEHNWIPGRLGVREGGGYTVDVPGRSGYVYVSLGVNGERGQNVARDAVGATGNWTQIKMRREHGQLVIREADNLAGGSGGVTTLLALTDVSPSPTDGDTLEWDTGTGTAIWVAPAGGAGGAPSPHARVGIHHTGLEAWSNIDLSVSSLADLASRSHTDLTGVNPNDHHNQVHVLVGSDHTASGLTTNHVLKATGATTFAFASPLHSITDTFYHSITGSQYQLVGATGINTLGLLTPSSTPGAAAAILRTDATGGLQLDTNLLYVDATNNRIGINQTPGAAALDVIVTTNADHTLRVKQKSGQSGRLWRVEDTAGDELIVLDSQGNLQSGQPGFTSGLTGWQVTPTGNAEFNNIWARGELHATVFVKDEIHATGGTMLVATAGKLYSDAVIDSTTMDLVELEITSTVGSFSDLDLDIETTQVGFAGTTLFVEAIFNYIEIDDPPSGPGFYFQPGDVVRSKTEIPTGVIDLWLEIINATQESGYSRYSVTKRSGTDGTLPAGSAVVSYGVEGDGRILLTSDLNYAPYMDVFTVGPNVWTGAAGAIVPHVRLGRLDGVGVTAVSGVEQYGMIAGTDLSDANSPYIVASNLQLRLHKVDLTLNDGTNDTGELTATGNLTLGTNIGVDAGKSFQFFSTGTEAGDLIVGQLTGSYVHWDASAETLTVNGSLTLGGLVGNSLEVGANGHINSAGKSTYADTDAGFFLGWDTAAYKFNLGDSTNFLKWDGDDMAIATNNAIAVNVPASKQFLQLQDGATLRTVSFTGSTDTISTTAETFEIDYVNTIKTTLTGDTFRIMQSRSNIPTSGSTGLEGEIAWNLSFLYVCVGANNWRRISLGAAF